MRLRRWRPDRGRRGHWGPAGDWGPGDDGDPRVDWGPGGNWGPGGDRGPGGDWGLGGATGGPGAIFLSCAVHRRERCDTLRRIVLQFMTSVEREGTM